MALFKVLHVKPGMWREKVGYSVFLLFFISTPAASQLNCLTPSLRCCEENQLLADFSSMRLSDGCAAEGGGATGQRLEDAFQKCKSTCRCSQSISSSFLFLYPFLFFLTCLRFRFHRGRSNIQYPSTLLLNLCLSVYCQPCVCVSVCGQVSSISDHKKSSWITIIGVPARFKPAIFLHTF